MSLANRPLIDFLDQLASAEPVPGGGSVAALAGALSASLMEMVCRLTIGKKGYEEVSAELQSFAPRLELLKKRFQELMQQDIDAFAGVMDAYRLPKGTDVERHTRSLAIQDALIRASDVPLDTAELCGEVIGLARIISEKGNKNAASDAAVGTLMAEAGLRGAALNVSINLASIKDQDYVASKRARITELEKSAEKEKQEILEIVEGKL